MSKNQPILRKLFFAVIELLITIIFIPNFILFGDTEIPGGTISTDTIWPLSGSPYIVMGDVSVNKSATETATLTIEAGTKVMFNPGTGLFIGHGNKGALVALGTVDNPIVFTSSKSTPAPGDWKGLIFYSGTDNGITSLDYCKIEYGGYYNDYPFYTSSNVICYYSSPKIKNSIIQNSSLYGFWFMGDSSPIIESCNITCNGGSGIYCRDAIPKPLIKACAISKNGNHGIEGGSPSVEGCPNISENGGYGAYLGGNFSLKNNTILNNKGIAVSISCDAVGQEIYGNKGSGNGKDYIEVRGGAIGINVTWKRQDPAEFPYAVTGDISVNKSATETATLTIEAGTKVMFNPGTGLFIGHGNKGALVALGTVDNPIVFTSSKSTPAPGDWKGLIFYSGTDNGITSLDYCKIEYGGYYNDYPFYTSSNVICYYSSPKIKNSIIQNSSLYGFWFMGDSSPIIESCNITCNGGSGIYCRDAIPKPLIKACAISKNGNHGIEGGSPSVEGCPNISENGGYGAYLGGNFSLKNNTILNNKGIAVSISCDAVGQEIYGNKGSGNGKDYIEVRGGAIGINVTWKRQDPAEFPYAVTGDISVNKSATETATLTIEAGTKVMFNPGTGLFIGHGNKGALVALGTVDNPIVFTSSKSTPAPGDWKGLIFYSGTDNGITSLDYCKIEYGGYYNDYPFYTSSNVICYYSSPKIKNSIIQNSSLYGFWFMGDSSPIIESCNITCNGGSGIYCRDAIPKPLIKACAISKNGNHGIEGGSPSVEGCPNISENGGYGAYLGGNFSLKNNTILNNKGIAVSISCDAVGQEIYGNKGSGNGKDYIEVRGGAIGINVTWKRQDPAEFPYAVTGDISVNKSATETATLTIEAGTKVMFNPGTGLFIGHGNKGALVALGTVDNPIVFTSSKSTPAPGDWKGLIFYSGTDNGITSLDYCKIEYGGYYNDYPFYTSSNVICYYSSPKIKNSIIQNSSLYGFWFMGDSSPIIESCNITCNGGSGIYCRDAIPKPLIKACAISKNGNHGIEGGSPSVEGCPNISENGGYGAYLGGNFSLKNNTILNNKGIAVSISCDAVGQEIYGNKGSGNGKDYIEVRGGAIGINVTWKRQDPAEFPYAVTGDISVNKSATETATLTIEAGTKVMFNPGTGLFIGHGNKGALVALGTVDNPIVFTSSKSTPAPGDWKGLIFYSGTDNGITSLDYCKIEYGGYYNDYPFYTSSNVICYYSSPKIKNSIIQNSSLYGFWFMGDSSPIIESCNITCNGGSGIYCRDAIPKPLIKACAISKNGNHGIESGSPVVQGCNISENNGAGVYVTGDALPTINYNNFLNNKTAGVSTNNSIGAKVNAKYNWWNDVEGPNKSGDKAIGNIDFEQWLTQPFEINPDNTPPYIPSKPVPDDAAVMVPLNNSSVTLAWVGGDPDPIDSVTYDVYFGIAADALEKASSNITLTNFTKTGLNLGTTYYWRIVSRDNFSAETSGPIWSFATQTNLPDLVVADLSFVPETNIGADETVTFTAVIQNTGLVSVLYPFNVDFQIDDATIGGLQVNQTIEAGQSVTLTKTWTAILGNHTVKVFSDCGNTLQESDETNNQSSKTLPEITDKIPPEMKATSPNNGETVYKLEKITFTLTDKYSIVDDEFVKSSFQVRNQGGQPISGAITEANDQFIFVPLSLPLPDDTYMVSFTAKDIAGNTKDYSFSFSLSKGTPVSGRISQNTIWTKANSPYWVIGDILVQGGLSSPVILTIEQGVTVRFNQEKSLKIGNSNGRGVLIAQGTVENPIVFTSANAVPAAGDWKGIYYSDYSDSGLDVLENCIVEYGGFKSDFYENRFNIGILRSSPRFVNCIIRNSLGYGVLIYDNCNPVFENCNISGNSGSGIYSTGNTIPKPLIKTCTISKNGNHGIEGGAPIVNDCPGISENGNYGIYLGNVFSLKNNIVSNNKGIAISISCEGVGQDIVGNIGSGNGGDFIEVRGGRISGNVTWKWQDQTGFLFIVTGDILVQGGLSSPVILTIEQGVTVRFNQEKSLKIGNSNGRGVLIAQGTVENPIVFTSANAVPAAGDWKGIYYSDYSDSGLDVLENCIVEYGGFKSDFYENRFNIGILRSSPRFVNCIIRNSLGYGVLIYDNCNPVFENCNISGNSGSGIYSTGNTIPKPLIKTCTILKNGNHGIEGGTASVDNCNISENVGNGAYLGGCFSLKNNTFLSNKKIAVSVPCDAVGQEIIGNKGSGNGGNYIEIRGGHIQTNVTYKNQGIGCLPYGISETITVRNATANAGATTLVIEPGTVLKFNAGVQLRIGYKDNNGYYYGALRAQGMADKQITFTSNKTMPAAADWAGIYFTDATDSANSFLEYCNIGYGGYVSGGAYNVYLEMARPTIQYNSIHDCGGVGTNGHGAGIYVNGSGCNGAIIRCNNFQNNQFGVYVTGNAQPLVTYNNFLSNQLGGVYNYNSSGAEINAENNWWGDIRGPNYDGDKAVGNVDYEPWIVAASDCINTPPANLPPYEPQTPEPTNNAVKVALNNGSVTLKWQCGDPDAGDTVKYDVHFGNAADNLVKVAENISDSNFSKDQLNQGATYFWKIVARDSKNAETSGQVWKFTALGDVPDLVVSGITYVPQSNISIGQEVTITGVIQNNGAGPVVDAFVVDFLIDGKSIGAQAVNQIIPVGESVTLTKKWTATVGDHAAAVMADSTKTVTEADETNNSLSVNLPPVNDITPPELKLAVPANGAVVNQLNDIRVTLFDKHGSVNDEFVKNNFIVTRGRQRETVPGTVSESNDVFIFTPATLPFVEGLYQVDLIAKDMADNSQAYIFSFRLDTQKPPTPTITGGTVFSGVIQVEPFPNKSNTTAIILTGMRDNMTAVWVNGAAKVPLGSGDWSVNLTLGQGLSKLEIWTIDAAGNRSDSVFVSIFVDSIAPVISSFVPADNSFLKEAPATVVVNYVEAGGTLNLDNTTKVVKDKTLQIIPGAWSKVDETKQLLFTPTQPFGESAYVIEVQLEDELANRGSLTISHFTIDKASPAAPTVNPVTSPTHRPNQKLTGAKEKDANILVNGKEAVGFTASTSWESVVSLQTGSNAFAITSADRAGNQSSAVDVTIVFEDIAPPPVQTLIAAAMPSGKAAQLNWTGYDETLHGDIDLYRVYAEKSDYPDITGLTPQATVNNGLFTCLLSNLEQDQTYYFAVVAVDLAEKFDPQVKTVRVDLIDKTPPENVTNLAVQSFENKLIFTWTHSANTQGDLKEYLVYFNNSPAPVSVHPLQNTYEADSLTPATGFPFKIAAKDQKGNESTGVSITGVTILPNPLNLAADPHSGYVNLTWTAVTPSQYVKNYALYVSETDFTTVANMTPRVLVTTNSGKIAGLTNGTTYYFAVTTINISNGERKEVTAITATPANDGSGPVIGGLKWNNAPLAENQILVKTGTLSVTASDDSGMSRVEFYLDDKWIGTDSNGSASYSLLLNLYSYPDGAHTIKIKAFDTLNNNSIREHGIVIQLAVPTVPVITSPEHGKVTNKPGITVSGAGEKCSQVLIYNNGTKLDGELNVDNAGLFSKTISLNDGNNELQVEGKNITGSSEKSPITLVTLDTSLPEPPGLVQAQAQASGIIRLNWLSPGDSGIKGFNIYRDKVPLTQISPEKKITATPVMLTTYADSTPEDATYFYRLTTVDKADNESEPSLETSAESDRAAPAARKIIYTPQGQYDPQTGRMGQGIVDMVLTVNEPLLTDPFFSLTPQGGVPISVELTKQSELEYKGFFEISKNSASGKAQAVFSARDLAGNRGTTIENGGTLLIDTQGPDVLRIDLDPSAPIQNDENAPKTVKVTIGLKDTCKPGTRPQLAYLISGDSSSHPIDNLVEIGALPGDIQAFTGTFELPATAGKDETQIMQFENSASDDLGNSSTRILCANSFEIYQRDLPSLATPQGLKGESLTGGKIKLTWKEVSRASDYQIYRQAPGEPDLTPYKRTDNQVILMDQPAIEGNYLYAVASARVANSQESLSPMSEAIQVQSDATAPAPPRQLTLELLGNGIKAQWQPPDGCSEPITYSLYRDNTMTIPDITNLTPIIKNITGTVAIDPNPSQDAHCYAVAALDKTGNISLPSNSFYLNFSLLPVSSIQVLQKDQLSPVISWSHSGQNIAGYNIYYGDEGQEAKLNTDLLINPIFTDTGFAQDQRRYAVTAVDDTQKESKKRTITLYPLKARLLNGATLDDFQSELVQILNDIPDFDTRIQQLKPLKRGIMNHLEYLVKNDSFTTLNSLKIITKVGSHQSNSKLTTINAQQYLIVPVIVGGHDDLKEKSLIESTIELIPNPGEKMEISRNGEIAVGNGMLVLTVQNDEFVRGVSGKVSFSLHNTGDEEIEIVTATGNGQAPSNEIVFTLRDTEDNVLSQGSFFQNMGSLLVTLADGRTVARIPAGGTFTSGQLELFVPAGTPNQAVIQASVANFYYHLSKEDQVQMAGINSRHEISLIDTAYYGEILNITPNESFGDQNIVITGRAVNRSDGQPLANVPLDLVIAVRGYERLIKVFSSGAGQFTHVFQPLAGETGLYDVFAVHPDLKDRKPQAHFVIKRVYITPVVFNLTMPRNYQKAIAVNVQTGEGTTLTNLRLLYETQNQPDGVFPAGVQVKLGAPIDKVDPNQTVLLPLTLWADNTAADSCQLIFWVRSNECPNENWTVITCNCFFTEAKPVLYFFPDHIDSGVAWEQSVSETITLENRGLAPMNDIKLSLLSEDGSPAPSWVFLNSAAQQGAMAVGEKKSISIGFSPENTVPEGPYKFLLRVESANHVTKDINLFVTVTQDGKGGIIYKIVDIYTGTLDQNGKVIQGLDGASIYIQNEIVSSIEGTLITKDGGEAFFENIVCGSYKYRIRANNHQEFIGRFTIKAGMVQKQEIFLDFNLVTVEWEVVPTTIEDIYEIILTTHFITDVPAAVVVAEPTSLTLPAMKTGDVYNAEFELVNHGLIQAEEITFNMPVDSEFFKMELLTGVPKILAAKASISIPYRVTCIKSPQESERAGCQRWAVCINVGYKYVCVNGNWVQQACYYCFTFDNGLCNTNPTGGGTIIFPPVGGSGSGGGTSGGGGGSGSSSGGSISGNTNPVSGTHCKTKPPCPNNNMCCLNSTGYYIKSLVSLINGDYLDNATDMTVKYYGHEYNLTRSFHDNSWFIDRLDGNGLVFNMESGSDKLKSIQKDGMTYAKANSAGTVFAHQEFGKIFALTAGGYRWEDHAGDWEEFNAGGRILSSGDRLMKRASFAYNQEGLLVEIRDQKDQPVLSFSRTEDLIMHEIVTIVKDNTGRQVKYATHWAFNEDEQIWYRAWFMIKDVLGREAYYFYDKNTGYLAMIRTFTGRIMYINYDSYNFITSMKDPNGIGADFEYSQNSSNKQFYGRVKASSGKILEKWFNNNGKMIRTDENGRTLEKVIYTSDGRGEISVDSTGLITRREKDEFGNLTKITYPDGAVATFAYDLRFNKISKMTNEKGVITENTYDDRGNLIRKVEAKGTASERISEYTWNEHGEILSEKILGDAKTPESLTTYAYDYLENKMTTTDPEGPATVFYYDIMGNVIRKIDARGKEWLYAYDPSGRLKLATDPLGFETSNSYDDQNNTQTVVDAEKKQTVSAYDVKQNLIQVTDHLGNKTTMTYDSENHLISATDPEGKQKKQEYDSMGYMTKTIDGNGNEISYQYDDILSSSCSTCTGSGQISKIIYPTFSKEYKYDKRGRQIKEIDILSAQEQYTTSFAYDPAGNLIKKTDKLGHVESSEYDELGRVVKQTNALGHVVEFTYDDRNNLLELKDAKGNITRFTYDRNNRKIKEVRPLGQTTTYEYNELGLLATTVDAKGQKIINGYDDAGRLIQIRYFAADNLTTPQKTVHFTYNKVGNLLSYNDGTTSATYEYDDLHRKIKETVNYPDFQKSFSYAYYYNGTKKSFTSPEGVVYDYTYDANNQLKSIFIPGQGNMTINEYQLNLPKTITLPGGTRKEFSYDPLMQLQSIVVKDPGQNLIMNYQYQRDLVGNITRKNTEHGTYNYTYDAIYQLTKADYPNLEDEEFVYDPAGNRLTHIEGTQTTTSTFNANNEILTSGATTFEFDANGSMTKQTDGETVTQYAYNTENRMEAALDKQGTTIAKYYYDPFGRRLSKKVGTNNPEYFLYTDEGLNAEFDSIGAIQKSYGFSPDSTWTTDPLFLKQGDTYYFYHNDHLGTPQQLTTPTGSPAWAAQYKAFGDLQISPSSAITNNLRFPGQYLDEETGFYYNFFRHYDSQIGKYLVIDPLDALKDYNKYNYSLNSPLNMIDPTGESSFGGGFGITADKILEKVLEWIVGGKPKFYPIFSVRWGGDCCCNGKKYKQKITNVSIRFEIKNIFYTEGGGSFNSCGPCEQDRCIGFSGGTNLLRIATSRIPILGGKIGIFLNQFASLRLNVNGQWCLNGGTRVNLGLNFRCFYIGSASGSWRIF